MIANDSLLLILCKLEYNFLFIVLEFYLCLLFVLVALLDVVMVVQQAKKNMLFCVLPTLLTIMWSSLLSWTECEVVGVCGCYCRNTLLRLLLLLTFGVYETHIRIVSYYILYIIYFHTSLLQQ